MRRVAVLVLLWGAAVGADALPDAPKPKHDGKTFWLGATALAGAKAADAWTTRRLLDHGGIETNPLFGRHPSTGKQIGINAGILALEVGGFWLTEHSRSRTVRWTGRVMLGYSVANHTQLAVCNSHINPHDTGRCSSLPGMAW